MNLCLDLRLQLYLISWYLDNVVIPGYGGEHDEQPVQQQHEHQHHLAPRQQQHQQQQQRQQQPPGALPSRSFIPCKGVSRAQVTCQAGHGALLVGWQQ